VAGWRDGSIFVVPAKAGTQGGIPQRWEPLLQQFVVEIPPLGIVAFDQIELPCPAPFLYALLVQYRAFHVLVKLNKDKLVDRIVVSETGDSTGSVLPYPPCKIAHYSNIERAVAPTRENVEARPVVGHASASDPGPRFREDGD
jgi:hypothetical protein